MILLAVLLRLLKTVLVIFLIPVVLLAEAKDEVTPELSWKMKMLRVFEGKREVQISIQVGAKGRVVLADDEQVHLSFNKKLNKIKIENIGNYFPQDLESGEVHQVSLNLPPGLVQIPIVFESIDSQVKKSYLISVNVDLTSDLPEKKVTELRVTGKNVHLWAGLGATYLAYSQTSDVASELTFKTTRVPSFSLSGELGLTESFYFSSFLNVAPGNVKASSSINFEKESYYWIIYGIEGVHLPKKLKLDKFNFGYRFGIQMHQMPFIQRTATNGVAKIETNSVGNLSLGPTVNYKMSENWIIQGYIRLQYNVFWGFLFEPDPNLNFDGNLALFWTPDPSSLWSYSIQWYGQSQKFNYQHTDVLLQDTSYGEIDLFFSGIDLRMGYRF